MPHALRGVEEGLQAIDGRFEAWSTTKKLRDLHDVAVGRDGRHLERVRDHELLWAEFAVLLEQRMENRLRLWAVLVEEIFLVLAELLCTLLAGAERRIEGEMAEQVERIRLGLSGRFRECLEIDAA